ncbi:hypothetical protein [Neobacillus vireti]|uniref:hypothetical protein n=1 Tax=Neobacillus vireti TaxID=220686 RepID=UPI002FFFAA80
MKQSPKRTAVTNAVSRLTLKGNIEEISLKGAWEGKTHHHHQEDTNLIKIN